jgi:hypothetical protein
MTTAVVVGGLVALGAVILVGLVGLTRLLIGRQLRRQRFPRDLGVVSTQWLSAHKAERW